MKNKRIEIVSSSLYWLSSMSIESCNSILGALRTHYSDVIITAVNNLSDLKALAERKPDLVFLGMKFIPTDYNLGLQDPNKIWITDYLEDNGIAYTGSTWKAHEAELNKDLAKFYVASVGLATSPFYVVKQGELPIQNDIRLNYPVFIKPTNRGGGNGIDGKSVATNFQELKSKVESISRELKSDSLIEEYLTGREFSVAILKHSDSEKLSVMPMELIAPPDENGHIILSSVQKSSNTEQVLAVSDESIRTSISDLAINCFKAINGRDYGRIDIRLDSHGNPCFLEANLIPSLIAGYGTFPKACLISLGLDYESMIIRIAELGMSRNSKSIKS